MKSLVSLILLAAWIAGVVLAKGVWSTIFAIVFPFWSYYLLIEQLITKYLT